MKKCNTEEKILASRDLIDRFNSAKPQISLISKHKESEGWVLEFEVIR